jgi:hypothetical protein
MNVTFVPSYLVNSGRTNDPKLILDPLGINVRTAKKSAFGNTVAETVYLRRLPVAIYVSL